MQLIVVKPLGTLGAVLVVSSLHEWHADADSAAQYVRRLLYMLHVTCYAHADANNVHNTRHSLPNLPSTNLATIGGFGS